MNSLRFHWRLAPQANRLGVVSQDAKLQESNSPEQQANLPNIENNLFFCRRAEEIGIDSVLLNLPKLTHEGFGASFLSRRRPLTAVCYLSSPQA